MCLPIDLGRFDDLKGGPLRAGDLEGSSPRFPLIPDHPANPHGPFEEGEDLPSAVGPGEGEEHFRWGEGEAFFQEGQEALLLFRSWFPFLQPIRPREGLLLEKNEKPPEEP